MKQRALILGALVVLIAVVYGELATHPYITYDDPDYVTRNTLVQRGLTADGVKFAFTALKPYYWHPLTWLSLMLDQSLWGLHAGPSLIENALLHAIAAILLFFTFAKATGDEWRSAAVAAIWAIHPLRVESVAWVAERKDVLCALFYIAALLAYVRGRKGQTGVIPSVRTSRRDDGDGHDIVVTPSGSEGSGGSGGARKGHFGAARTPRPLALARGDSRVIRSVNEGSGWSGRRPPARSLALARNDKWVIVFYLLALMAKPMAVMLPFALLLLDYWPLQRRPSFVDKIPLFVISAAAAALTYFGHAHAIGELPLKLRVANAVISYLAYLGKLVAPIRLAAIYPYDLTLDGNTVFVCAVLLIGLTIAAFVWKRYLRAGWLWYVITLLPVIGLVQVGAQSMADRFTYIPSIGIIAALVWLIANMTPRKIAAGIGIAVVAVLAALSFRQVTYWRDSDMLFQHAIDVTDDNVVAHLSLAADLRDEGKQAEATEHYLEAARLSHGAPLPLAAAGEMLIQEQRYGEAVPLLREALSKNPNLPGAKENLAMALIKSGQSQDVGALATNPKTAADFNNLGSAYATKDDAANAERAFREAIRLDPKLYDARMNIAALLSRAGRNDEALEQLDAASKLQPKSVEPRIYRALVLSNLHRRAEAAAVAEEAKRIDAKASNDFLTKAVRMPPGETNLDQFIAAMRSH